MRVTGWILVLGMVGCDIGGPPVTAGVSALDALVVDGGAGEAAPDVDGASPEGSVEASGGDDGGVDGDRVDAELLDGGGDGDARGLDGDAGDGHVCTPLPPVQFACGVAGCLLQNGEACLHGDAGPECMIVPTACTCLETYTCACVAPGETCVVSDAGAITVTR